jgi:hypothetical protein
MSMDEDMSEADKAWIYDEIAADPIEADLKARIERMARISREMRWGERPGWVSDPSMGLLQKLDPSVWNTFDDGESVTPEVAMKAMRA